MPPEQPGHRVGLPTARPGHHEGDVLQQHFNQRSDGQGSVGALIGVASSAQKALQGGLHLRVQGDFDLHGLVLPFEFGAPHMVGSIAVVQKDSFVNYLIVRMNP